MMQKEWPTDMYADRFFARICDMPKDRHIVLVDPAMHRPMICRVGTLTADRMIEKLGHHRVAGYFQHSADLTAQDIADAIDAVDPFVPRAYRDESRAAL